MPKSTTPKTVTPAMVRAFYNDPKHGAKRTEGLPESARKSVQPGARGRIAPQARAGYNKGKPSGRHYVEGVQRTAALAKVSAAKALRAKALEAGIPVNAKGPLPKAAKALA